MTSSMPPGTISAQLLGQLEHRARGGRCSSARAATLAACSWTALTTLGWQWPVLTTAMPMTKSSHLLAVGVVDPAALGVVDDQTGRPALHRRDYELLHVLGSMLMTDLQSSRCRCGQTGTPRCGVRLRRCATRRRRRRCFSTLKPGTGASQRPEGHRRGSGGGTDLDILDILTPRPAAAGHSLAWREPTLGCARHPLPAPRGGPRQNTGGHELAPVGRRQSQRAIAGPSKLLVGGAELESSPHGGDPRYAVASRGF